MGPRADMGGCGNLAPPPAIRSRDSPPHSKSFETTVTIYQPTQRNIPKDILAESCCSVMQTELRLVASLYLLLCVTDLDLTRIEKYR